MTETQREPLARRYAIVLSIAGALLVLDLATKRWAARTFTAAPEDVLGSFLQFRFVENPGGAFSMFPAGGTFFAVAAFVAIGAVLWFVRSANTGWEVAAFGLILAGAAGNLVDRVARGPGLVDGPVIDWVNLWEIPTFNVADASVTVAVVVLLIGAWRTE